MAFGFPAYAEAIEQYDGCSRDELLDAVDDALEALNWNADYSGRSSLTASTGVSFWSWGERITIKVSEEVVRVRSQCTLPTQCLDWGKNRRNIDKLLLRLEKIINREKSRQGTRRRSEQHHE